MANTARQERTVKRLNNVVQADFTKNKASIVGHDQAAELRKNIEDIVNSVTNKDLLEEIRSKAKLMQGVEQSQNESAKRMDSLVTEKELQKYHKFKSIFVGTVVLMRIGELMFAFEDDACRLEYLGTPLQLTDSKQTPYFCFHHSDSARIHKIKTSMDATIIM